MRTAFQCEGAHGRSSTCAPFRSGGTTGSCDGVFRIDTNAFASGAMGGTPAPWLLSPGEQVNAQWSGRDTAATGSFLSKGIEWKIEP